MPRKQSAQPASLTRAKQLFIANFILFTFLLLVAFLILNRNDNGESTKAELGANLISEKPLSLRELAHLKGEMQALREYPGTMPPYEEEWARKHAEQAIRRDRSYDGADESLILILINEYFRAYTERFEDYYDDQAAREFGYHYGVKFNPDLHGLFPRETYGLLIANREKLEQAFAIPDEATWRLFCEAFDKGFVQGYRVIEEGVTVESLRDKIMLFPE